MKNSLRKGLFHPDDIKTVGLSAPSGPLSAPLPCLSRKSSRPGLNLITNVLSSNGNGSGSNSNTQKSTGSGGAGSFGKADAKKTQGSNGIMSGDLEKFDKYAEEDDEDYEDVFGKPNGTSECYCFFILDVVDEPYVCLLLKVLNRRWRA